MLRGRSTTTCREFGDSTARDRCALPCSGAPELYRAQDRFVLPFPQALYDLLQLQLLRATGRLLKSQQIFKILPLNVTRGTRF